MHEFARWAEIKQAESKGNVYLVITGIGYYDGYADESEPICDV